MTYVVVHSTRQSSSREYEQYLGAIQYDPYAKGAGSIYLTTDEDEAFTFRTLEAAEMAAVWIGGRITHKGYVLEGNPE